MIYRRPLCIKCRDLTGDFALWPITMMGPNQLARRISSCSVNKVDDMVSTSKFIKVKRAAEDAPLSLLVHENAGRACVYALSNYNHPVTAIDGIPLTKILNDLKIEPPKRRRVEAIVVKLSLDDLQLSPTPEQEGDEVYDYYVRQDLCTLDSMPMKDPSQVGIITAFQQEIQFASDEEASIADDDYDEDSNAEDHYGNDYPDEDEDDNIHRNYRWIADDEDDENGISDGYYYGRGKHHYHHDDDFDDPGLLITEKTCHTSEYNDDL